MLEVFRLCSWVWFSSQFNECKSGIFPQKSIEWHWYKDAVDEISISPTEYNDSIEKMSVCGIWSEWGEYFLFKYPAPLHANKQLHFNLFLYISRSACWSVCCFSTEWITPPQIPSYSFHFWNRHSPRDFVRLWKPLPAFHWNTKRNNVWVTLYPSYSIWTCPLFLFLLHSFPGGVALTVRDQLWKTYEQCLCSLIFGSICSIRQYLDTF